MDEVAVPVASCVLPGMGVEEGVLVEVEVDGGSMVGVDEPVATGVRVFVAIGVGVATCVAVAVGVNVGVALDVAVSVAVGVLVDVAVRVAVAVVVGEGVEEGVDVGVGEAVGVGGGASIANRHWGAPSSAPSTPHKGDRTVAPLCACTSTYQQPGESCQPKRPIASVRWVCTSGVNTPIPVKARIPSPACAAYPLGMTSPVAAFDGQVKGSQSCAFILARQPAIQ